MEIKRETLQHCFRKAGFTVFCLSMDDATGNNVQEHYGRCDSDALLWDRVAAAGLTDDCESFESFLIADGNVQAVLDMRDDAIVVEAQAVSVADEESMGASAIYHNSRRI